jgi:hypothetical protein
VPVTLFLSSIVMLHSGAATTTSFSKVPQRGHMAAMQPPYLVLTNQNYVRQRQLKLGLPILVLEGVQAESPDECALACTAKAGCDYASWHGANPTWQSNITCYLKHISKENYNCSVVATAEYSSGTYLLVRQTSECALSPLP